MSAKTDTWMPLHIGAYLGDTMHLRTAEHGAYILLLMHYWRSGPLPDDDRKLSGIARMTATEWEDVSDTIREFFVAEDGRLHQKRADAERARAQQISSKRADAARAMHEQKACKPDANAPANAEQMHTHAGVEVEVDTVSDVSLGSNENKEIASQQAVVAVIPFNAIAAVWNEVCGAKCQRVKSMPDHRKRKVSARWGDIGGIDAWRSMCVGIAGSAFLTGANDRGWRADFDWCLEPKNFTKIDEGKYANRAGQAAEKPARFDWVFAATEQQPDDGPIIELDEAA